MNRTMICRVEADEQSKCYCGHDCAKCVTYIATRSNDDDLRARSQLFYKEQFGQDIPLEQINCMGGRSDNIFTFCQECPFKKCCQEREIEACEICTDYPCDILKDYQRKYVNKCNQMM